MSDWDRLKDSLFTLVRGWTARFDYHAIYMATVKSQAADFSLGVVFDDARFPPSEGIPLRLGLPGVTVKVSAGARVLVGFENGDPKKPYASLWVADSLVELVLTSSGKVTVNSPDIRLGDDGVSHAVGRVGDAVSPTASMVTWLGTVGTVIGTPPPASFGTIAAGSSKVKG